MTRKIRLAALIGVLVTAAIGGGIALAASLGTAGELLYVEKHKDFELNEAGGAFLEVKVPCPNRRHVAGGGFRIFGGNVETSMPFDDGDAGTVPDDGWYVGIEDENGNNSIDVYAICDD